VCEQPETLNPKPGTIRQLEPRRGAVEASSLKPAAVPTRNLEPETPKFPLSLPLKIKTLILKTPASDLHNLIQSLNAAEKRYFRLFAARHPADGQSNYLRLFDLIAVQEEYDEAALKSSLEGDLLLRHFAVTKRYLYDQILECLHQFHAVQSVEEAIKKQVHLASVLLQKDLPKQSEKLLQQARRQIDKYELLSLMPEWLTAQRAVQDRLRAADAQAVMAWKNDADAALKKLSVETDYAALSAIVGLWHVRKVSAQDNSLQEYLHQNELWPLLSEEAHPPTLRAQLDGFKARATWHFMRSEPQEAYRLNLAHLALLDEHPELLQLYPRRYLAALNNLLIDQFQLRLYEELEGGIQKLKSLLERPEFRRVSKLEEKIFEQSALLRLNSLLARRQYAEALEALPAIEADMQHLSAGISPHLLLSIQFLIARLYFENERFGSALHWLNALLQHPGRQLMEELFRFAGILKLLVHFELEHDELLPYLIESARRQGVLSGRRYQAENLCFKYLKKLLQATGSKGRQRIFTLWKNDLLPLAAITAEQRIFNYIDFNQWLEKKHPTT
jgi:hypothetical protein